MAMKQDPDYLAASLLEVRRAARREGETCIKLIDEVTRIMCTAAGLGSDDRLKFLKHVADGSDADTRGAWEDVLAKGESQT